MDVNVVMAVSLMFNTNVVTTSSDVRVSIIKFTPQVDPFTFKMLMFCFYFVGVAAICLSVH